MPPETAPLSVSALTQRIKSTLEKSFPTLLVQGELSNCKLHTSGHFYFSLKDEHAQIAGVMWRSKVGSLSFAPKDGMKVIVSGRLTVYDVRGTYQLDASSIRTLGVGELQLAFEALKRKLEAEGLFAQERKRPLPRFPERIGIVTSATGAALQDIIRTLSKRFPVVEAILFPVRVQGNEAAPEIAEAIAAFTRQNAADVLIVGRGGGSLEDLWPFNEEVVARAIAASAIPVISAVGHETDFTIADFVADARAATPTAAAMLAVPDRRAILDTLRDSCYTMQERITARLEGHKHTIRGILKSYAFNKPLDLLRQYTQRTDDLQHAVVAAGERYYDSRTVRLIGLQQRLSALGPRKVLARGYAIVHKNGEAVGTRTALKSRDAIDIEFHDGKVRSTVD